MNEPQRPQPGSIETSVIVRAFNEEKYLGRLFDALDQQTYRNFEVILVDSGSFDRTRQIAESRADRVIRISSHDFTFGYSLNVGIRAAEGRYIAIVSAHTVPKGSDWLQNLIAPLGVENTAMCYGRQIGVRNSRFGEAEDFERLYGPEPRTDSPTDLRANNANSAIRRDLWEQYPFDERLTGLEDLHWARYWLFRGWRVVYEPTAVLYHIHEESWRRIHRRFFREAVAARHLSIKGRRHVPAELVRETGHTIADLARAFYPNGNPVADRLTVDQRLRETVYYRFHKTMGTVRGLLETHSLESPEDRERALFDRSGKAVVIHGPGKAALEDVEIPELKPGDVLIRVAHVAVCATDLEIRDGRLGYFQNGLASFPIVPGHEFSGRIVAIGTNADGFAEGDAVVVECIQGCGICGECQGGNPIGCAERAELGVMRRNGAYAEYVVAPARFVHRVPDNIDLRAAALTEPLAVILKGLRRLDASLANRQTPRRCAVFGAGPLGHLCARVLAHRNHEVVAIDRKPERLAFFEGTKIEATDDLDRIADCHVVVEVTGDPDALHEALHRSPADATLLLLGLPYGRREFSFEAIAAYDKTVIGSVGSKAEDFEAALELLPALDLNQYFECSLPLDEFEQAWQRSTDGDVLKVMLSVEDPPAATGTG